MSGKGKESERPEESAGGLKRCRSRARRTRSEPEDSSAKTPCLYAQHRKGFGPMVYTVNFDKGESPPLQRITPLKSRLVPRSKTVVALGSTIYVLGGFVLTKTEGEFRSLPNVLYFDANHEGGDKKKAWKRGPDMLNARLEGKAVAVEGKIYVFGGNDLKEAPEPWGEVFDPMKNKWTSLKPPPQYLDPFELQGPIIAYGDEENKKILLGNTTNFVYHVKSGDWENLGWGVYGRRGIRLKPVGVGNILYWTDRGKLVATNIKTQKCYEGKIKGSMLGEKKMLRRYGLDYDPDAEPQLIHLGGREFCFFTLKTVGKRTKVCCDKFRVSKLVPPPPTPDINGGQQSCGILKGSLVSSVACIVDQPLQTVGHGLLLDGRPDAIKEVEGKVSNAKDKQVLVKENGGGSCRENGALR